MNSISSPSALQNYTFDRPDYQALERFIKIHWGLAQYLVILDHNRFSRNLPEARMKIEQLEKKHNLKVLSTDEPIYLDTQDPGVMASAIVRVHLEHPTSILHSGITY